MSSKHILVTLPSNASGDIFPENKQSCYRTRLAQPLRLEGDWTVALAEIHIPCTWFNITHTTNTLEVRKAHEQQYCQPHDKQLKIPERYYGSTKDLLQTVNKYVSTVAKDDIEFKYDSAHNRVFLESTKHLTGIKFPSYNSGLGMILGFNNFDEWLPGDPCSDSSIFKNQTPAKYPPDMTGGITSMYVYSDIVEHQYVGDSTAPLLRIVPVDRQSGNIIYRVFDIPDFIPVSRERIDTIEIDIRNDKGEPIIFESGKVIVKLHFRLGDD